MENIKVKLDDLKEIPAWDSFLLEKKLTHIEYLWNIAFDGKDCDNEKRLSLFKESKEELASFLKDINLYNEWNEFNLQKIGWPEFSLFEVKNNSNSQIVLRLGPDMRNEAPDWSDVQNRILILRYLQHYEIKSLNEKIKRSTDFQRAYNEATNKLLNRLWSDEDE